MLPAGRLPYHPGRAPMFAKYYQSELTYLREMGRAFAQAHPSTAQMLSERGSDPDVERLLEGFAFISAQTRERVDDAVPSIVHNLTDLLLPHYLRPIPAAAIVEFSPHLRSLRDKLNVPAGTPLGAKSIDGTSCQFQTTSDVELLPIEVGDTEVDASHKTRPVLRVKMTTSAAGQGSLAETGRLQFHLHGQLALTSALMLWLTRHCVAVRVCSGTQGPVTHVPATAIRLTGFDPKNAMLPWPERTPTTFRTLQEYFTLPDKFLFFEVRDLHHVVLEEESFAFEFEFDNPPPLPDRVTKNCVRLHCTPIINLFSASADPIKTDAPLHEHPLRASGTDPLHTEIYSIDGVTGLQHGRQAKRQYEPFFAYRHQATGEEAAYYSIRRQHSSVDGAIDSYLSLVTPRDGKTPPVGETLATQLTCTNRLLPNNLKVGDVHIPARGSPSAAGFCNITAVTAPLRLALGSDVHWRLLAHLALNHRGLSSATDLRDTLSLYNFQTEAQPQVAHNNAQCIAAIREAQARPATRLFGGAPVRGTQTTIEFDESRFGSIGEACLFATVLDDVFAGQVSLNSFHELVIRLHPSDRLYRWKPRTGTSQRA